MPPSSDRPIIYLRGFAATQSEIEATVATPYMGFNLGSTKLRQSYDGQLVPFVFESPLVRLIKDEGYTDCFDKGTFWGTEGDAPPLQARSVWIYRYYEEGDEVSAVGARQDIEEWAAGLQRFIERVRECVCKGDPAARADFKVHLVAHSMGGLIVRSYLQAFCRGRLPGHPEVRESMVDKVFTYGTPHGGIEVRGINVPDAGRLDPLDVGNFNHARMRAFLGLAPDQPVNSLDGAHPVERFFCFVGTNHRDYAAFGGLSKRAVGAMSDGLVKMKNAYVAGAPRAYAHRSHSGPFGLVNSEEGYQNLRRFLFGNVRVDVKLAVDRLTLPPELAELRREAEHEGRELRIRGKYHISTGARVRNATYQLHERRTAFGSQQLADYDAVVDGDEQIYLFSGFLSRAGLAPELEAAARSGEFVPLAFQVECAVEVPLFELDRRFWFDRHFPGEELFRETATFYVHHDGERARVSCTLSSNGATYTNVLEADSEGFRDVPNLMRVVELERPEGGPGGHRYLIPIGQVAEHKASLAGALILEVRPWD